MSVEVNIINEFGYEIALEGLSYNHLQPIERMPKVLEKLSSMGGGHDKVLRMIQVWMTLRCPRFFWQEFDTYKIGTTASSESTMHSIHKRLLLPTDFDDNIIDSSVLESLNAMVVNLQVANDPYEKQEALIRLKRALPEGFMQKRMVNLNYAVLRNIIAQRSTHKLPHWQQFVSQVFNQIEHPELLKHGE